MSPVIEHEHFENLEAVKEVYSIGAIIGYGTYGTVFKAIDIKTNSVKALKILLKNSNNSDRYNQEIKILSRISHPNIIILEKVLETPQKLLLVFEYCPRELRKILDERKTLDENEIHQIMQYLISAVYYLHLNSIVHRDLKVENILLTDNPSNPNDQWFIKLIDYGLSSSKHSIIVKQNSGTNFVGPINMHAEFCGTPQYMAPELITKSYSRQCDIWSIGIIMYLLFKGSFPYQLTDAFQNSENYSVAKEIITNTTVDYDSLECSNEAIELIKKCLTINPAMRITAGEMLHYDIWITGGETNNNVIGKNTNILLLMDEYNNNNLSRHYNSCTSIVSDPEFHTDTNRNISIQDEVPFINSSSKKRLSRKHNKNKNW